MENIKITVANKIATVEDAPCIVCGNSDYTVTFTLDDEWTSVTKKIARFSFLKDGINDFIEVEFEGDTCEVPVLSNINNVIIGVYGGGLATTKDATVRCKKSILCGEGTKVADLYKMGKESVPNPLEYAVSVANVFSQVAFTDGYNLTIALPNCTAFTYFCYLSTGLKTVTLKEFKEDFALAMAYAFRNCTSLEMIDFGNKTIKIGVGTDTFRGATILKEIKGILDLTEITSVTNMFEACSSLEEVRFKANSIKLSISFAKCPKLSSETVQSIVDGLATVENLQTLSLPATIKANLTEEQMTTILTKNWVVQ